eukprot:PhF_6_TR36345/c0_g1_i1/m.53275
MHFDFRTVPQNTILHSGKIHLSMAYSRPRQRPSHPEHVMRFFRHGPTSTDEQHRLTQPSPMARSTPTQIHSSTHCVPHTPPHVSHIKWIANFCASGNQDSSTFGQQARLKERGRRSPSTHGNTVTSYINVADNTTTCTVGVLGSLASMHSQNKRCVRHLQPNVFPRNDAGYNWKDKFELSHNGNKCHNPSSFVKFRRINVTTHKYSRNKTGGSRGCVVDNVLGFVLCVNEWNHSWGGESTQ